jgi:hypothetical protein
VDSGGRAGSAGRSGRGSNDWAAAVCSRVCNTVTLVTLGRNGRRWCSAQGRSLSSIFQSKRPERSTGQEWNETDTV